MAKLWSERQKEKDVKLTVNWWSGRSCWRKKIDGHTRYFHYPNSADGYSAAVAEYHAHLQSLQPTKPLQREYEHHIHLIGQFIEWYDRFGTPDDEDELREEIQKFHSRLEAELRDADEPSVIGHLLPDGVNPAEKMLIIELAEHSGIAEKAADDEVLSRLASTFGMLGWKPSPKWQERLRQLERISTSQKRMPQTVGHQIKRFLDFKAAQTAADELAPTTWGDLAERLSRFESWIGSNTHVSTISGSTVKGYYQHLCQLRAAGKLGRQRAHNLLQAAKQWIRWAWREDDVDLENLPRNIDDRELRFTTHIDDKTGRRKQTRTEQLFTKEELGTMLKLLSERFSLYVLLCLNCGFTQNDLATLRKDELRLEQGRIVRQRSKTRRHQNPPVVSYNLWPKTLALLKKHVSDHPELVLLTKCGTPLIVSKVVTKNDENHHIRYDTVCRTYGRLRKKHTELPRKSLKFLRKTGSTKIKGDRRFMGLDQLYLGHSHQTIADKHYNAFDGEPYAPLDEAIEWLGKQFGFVK